jgi:tetratricopeptide (TPR) repeat protein
MTYNHLEELQNLEKLAEIRNVKEFVEIISQFKIHENSKLTWENENILISSLKKIISLEEMKVEEILGAAFAFIFLGDEEVAVQCINNAKKILDFDFELSGVHGRKTRHQTKTCLILVAKILKSNISPPSPLKYTKNVLLEDEDLIEETIKHDDFVLGRREAMILLAEAYLLKQFQPRNDSDNEKILAFISRIINDVEADIDPEIRICSLYLRSIVQDQMNPKYLNRSCKQLEVLLNSYNNEFDYTKCLLTPTAYELKAKLAENYCKQGQLIKALEIFKDLSLFDEQITCMLHLGMIEEAINLLQVQIENEPVDAARWRFMCTLASLKKESTLLEEVWNLSQNKFSPAAKLLAQHYYSVGEWAQSTTWLKSYLELSPTDSSAWFLLGCSAMQLKQWDEASAALLRTTSIDPDNAQAWNNLAASYAQNQRNSEALKAFEQASKLDYDNLRIWQNISAISELVNDQINISLSKKRISELSKNK